MAFSSLLTQSAGAGANAAGAYWSSRNQKAALRGQADLAEINAGISELGAQNELLRGQQQVASQTLQAGQLKSKQRVAMAANGVVLGEGSAAEVAASTDIMKEIDKNTIEANAVKSAWGYRTQAVNQRNEAVMKRGTADGISPGLAATSSLLGSASTVGGNWYQYNKAGALG